MGGGLSRGELAGWCRFVHEIISKTQRLLTDTTVYLLNCTPPAEHYARRVAWGVYDNLGQLTRENNEILGKTYVYTYDNRGSPR